jgi:hypothetical protein
MRSTPGATPAITDPPTNRISCVRCCGSDVYHQGHSEHRDKILAKLRSSPHTGRNIFEASLGHSIAGKLD